MPGCRKGNEHFVRCLFLWDAGREEQRSLEAFIWETDHQAAKKKGLRHCIDIEVLGEQTLLKAFCRESRQSGCYSFNAYLTAAKHGGFAGSVSDPGADGTIPIMQFNGFHSIRETIAAARACLPATMAAGFRAFPCSPSAVFRSLRIIAGHGRYGVHCFHDLVQRLLELGAER